ncbi:MAG: hypothetical protein KGI78_00160 [Patescibacteria group bacterium]|nr:hypothetical protein [Patescibacteria group bacterium]MDE1944168.1 hypothetical protein [Patescibacteria group bacterium]MDE1945448.1 hypothetical protein [Patescibacteria group bacterium]MDE2057251.1 hypothetical protein [Patescibacteria group bacterium]
MNRALIAVVLAVVLGYGLFEGYPLLAGPSLVVASPAEGAHAPDGVVTVSGRAARTVALTLDGAALLPDQSGRFGATLAFPPGGSILTFTATDRFGRRTTVTRAIYVP